MPRLNKKAAAVGLLLLCGSANALELTGWSRSDAGFNFRLRCERNVQYLIERSTNLIDWHTVLRSIGPATNRRIEPLGSNDFVAGAAFFRAVRTNEPLAMVARHSIQMRSAYVDSFNSSDANYSSNGLYYRAKAKDTAVVASLSLTNPAIDTGTGMIYGYGATSPGASVIGTIGNIAWCAGQTGIQPGHVQDDFAVALSDVAPPYSQGLPFPLPDASGAYTLTNGDYYLPSPVSATTGVEIIVAGTVQIYAAADFKISGMCRIRILSAAKLEMYLGGAGNITGVGILNETRRADRCAIYGLPTCSSVVLAATADLYATIYAPQAAVTLSGPGDASGSIVANTIQVFGMGVHYDEALR